MDKNIKKFINNTISRLEEGLKIYLDELNSKNDDFREKLTEEQRELFDKNNEENVRNLNLYISEFKEYNVDNIKSYSNAQLLEINKMMQNSYNKVQTECMDKINEVEYSDSKLECNSDINSDDEVLSNELSNDLYNSIDFSNILPDNDSDCEDRNRMDFFNMFDSNIEIVSETSLGSSNYEDTTSDNRRIELELLNVGEVKDLAKSNGITLSKDGKKKNKSELINDILNH